MIDYHRELLADEKRTKAFREAILRTVKPGDVVVDVGCGSGILSFFACEAGAARVYAIDQTHLADVASFLSRHLGVDDRVTVLHGEAKTLELPERADVLLSETLGVAGLDEGIGEIVADARARFLRPGARIVPQRVGVSIMPVELDQDYDRHVGFFGQPRYGLDLSPLRLFASSSIHFAHIRSAAYLDAPAEVLSIDLQYDDSRNAAGRAHFTSTRDAQIHGFGMFFSATLAEGIELSNREAHSTSWSQAFLPLEVPVQIRRGATIDVELQSDAGRSWRWRGDAAGEPFDQTTWLSMPPCEVPA